MASPEEGPSAIARECRLVEWPAGGGRVHWAQGPPTPFPPACFPASLHPSPHDRCEHDPILGKGSVGSKVRAGWKTFWEQACELSAGRIRPRSEGAALDLDLDLDPDPRRAPSQLRAPARDGTNSEQSLDYTSRAVSVPPRGPFRRAPRGAHSCPPPRRLSHTECPGTHARPRRAPECPAASGGRPSRGTPGLVVRGGARPPRTWRAAGAGGAQWERRPGRPAPRRQTLCRDMAAAGAGSLS